MFAYGLDTIVCNRTHQALMLLPHGLSQTLLLHFLFADGNVLMGKVTQQLPKRVLFCQTCWLLCVIWAAVPLIVSEHAVHGPASPPLCAGCTEAPLAAGLEAPAVKQMCGSSCKNCVCVQNHVLAADLCG